MAFFLALFTCLCSIASRVTKKIPNTSSYDNDQNNSELCFDATPKELPRPPSSTPTFTQAELLSAVLKRIGEVEEKVDALKAKPSEMPYEKEELLNAAVCRVDALEAELIATKKVTFTVWYKILSRLFLWSIFTIEGLKSSGLLV